MPFKDKPSLANFLGATGNLAVISPCHSTVMQGAIGWILRKLNQNTKNLNVVHVGGALMGRMNCIVISDLQSTGEGANTALQVYMTLQWTCNTCTEMTIQLTYNTCTVLPVILAKDLQYLSSTEGDPNTFWTAIYL